MRKNSAFTLIELLAVILILAIISIITVPIIMGIISTSKKATFERSIDGILEAVRLDWVMNDTSVSKQYFYNDGELALLKQGEESNNRIIKMKGKLKGNGFVYVEKDGIRVDKICSIHYCASGKENNIIITENEEGKIPQYNVTDPMISLNGNEIVYVEQNETYEELGAIAKTVGGDELDYITEIRLQDEIVTYVDTSVENTYQITYIAKNAGMEAKVTRTVVILNMTPIITMTKSDSKYVNGKEVLITVSTIKPNIIIEFQYKIKKDGKIIEEETVSELVKILTLSETGNYQIEVTVKDDHNHIKTETSGVYKIDMEPPKIEFTEDPKVLNANEISDFKFEEDDTVKVSDNSAIVELEVIGDLSTLVGEQEVIYIAIDEAGNETRKTRMFQVASEDGPVINYSSASTNDIWVKELAVTIYARIEAEDDELTEFTYQVDDGQIVNVPITNNREMEAIVN